MRIAESQITMQSSHIAEQQYVKKESLRQWIGEKRPDFESADQNKTMFRQADNLTLSPEALILSSRAEKPLPSSEILSNSANESIDDEDPKLRTIRMLIEAITGKKINIARIGEFKAAPPDLNQIATNPAAIEPQREDWGIEYDSSEEYSESEGMNFTSTGTIITQDGQEVGFSVALSLSREFTETKTTRIRLGDARLVDPLVINYDGTAAQLTGAKFAFDLDSDGTNENIPHLLSGSGFLFIDKNNDGRATNGNELFGPSTGKGFNELAAYDLDHNGWLDKNDPVFADLLIWSKNNAGSDYFSSLAGKNIGALYLRPQTTEFSLKDQGNALQAKIQETSIFLKEDGKAGTVQEIHLTV